MDSVVHPVFDAFGGTWGAAYLHVAVTSVWRIRAVRPHCSGTREGQNPARSAWRLSVSPTVQYGHRLLSWTAWRGNRGHQSVRACSRKLDRSLPEWRADRVYFLAFLNLVQSRGQPDAAPC